MVSGWLSGSTPCTRTSKKSFPAQITLCSNYFSQKYHIKDLVRFSRQKHAPFTKHKKTIIELTKRETRMHT